MVDEFASLWPIVALEGVGELIGDARPGLVAVDGGRRLGWANAAAASLFGAAPIRDAALAVDGRLADRIARFAGRAAPGEEARELLRFTQAGRPVLRSVFFRRPVDADDAVIAIVDAAVANPDPLATDLARFTTDHGLAALFDAEGTVLGAVGDLSIAESVVEEMETALAEADEVAVLERTLTGPEGRHALVLVRLGDHPDARRLLRLSPLEPPRAVTAPAAPVGDAAPAVRDAASSSPQLEVVPEITTPVPSSTPDIEIDEKTPDRVEEAAPLLETLEAPDEVVSEPSPATSEPEIDEDRFVAAPPLVLDLLEENEASPCEEDAVAPTFDVESEEIAPTAAVAGDAPALTEVAHEVATPAPTDAKVEPLEQPATLVEAVSVDAPGGDAIPTPFLTTTEAIETIAIDVPLAAEVEVPPLVALREDEAFDPEALLPEPQQRPIAGSPVETETQPEMETTPEQHLAARHDDDTAAASTEAVVDEGVATKAPAVLVGGQPLERPVKFVWQMDAERRFTLVSEEFATVVGPAAADLVGRRWDEIAERFDVDRDGAVGRALSRRDTWSGRSVLWPIQGTATRIPVDFAALPAFDRGRTFVGFRGFGTCRAEPPVPDPRAVGLRLGGGEAPDRPLARPGTPELPHLAEPPSDPFVAITSPSDEPVATVPPSETEPAALVPPPLDAPAVACVVEALAEPPLYPDDRESAEDEVDHPIEPAFAGDIGDDVLLSEAEEPTRAVEPAATEAVTSTSTTVTPEATTTEDDASTSVAPVEEAPRAAPRLVALDASTRPAPDAARLSVPERHAFRQIAEALGARIEGEAEGADARAPAEPVATTIAPLASPTPPAAATPSLPAARFDVRLLDRLPLAVALLRDDTLVHANERFLSLLRYPDLAALHDAGGADALFAGPHAARRFETTGARPMPLIAHDGTVVPCDARITPVPIEGGGGLLLVLTEHPAPVAAPVAAPSIATAADVVSTTADRERIEELQAIIDTATDGVLMLDASGLVLSANAGAEALFGVERRAMIGRPLSDRLAPESRRSATDYLDGLAANGVASVLNDGREVIGVVAPEGLIPLFMTIGRVTAGPVAKYCAVLRDITHWKKSEEELTAARRRAEEASIHKSDFLAKISHEIRTPLNAIIGFSELMLDERFGPVGNERYKDYLRDIHVSGSHIMSLINDLLDLSKVEAGKMDLRFEAVPLAEVVSECVALMQPQANRERIIIRSSLPAGVPPVVADLRSMRQVVLNLLSNAVKFTPAGGQVIVSITLEDNGEVALRVRDTGYGMSEKELQTAMEPFRQLHTTRSRSGGTGLGLPLTKALTEANRAAFRIDSTVGQGTLASVTFPVTRVLAG